jgi:integrase
MSRINPSYRLHKKSGQAVVTIRKQTIYLGKFNSPESKKKYADLIRDFQAGTVDIPAGSVQTMAGLAAAYLSHCKEYYAGSTEYLRIKRALVIFLERTRDMEVCHITKKNIKYFQQDCVDRNHCRRYINMLTLCLMRCFKWLAANDYILPNKYNDLQLVPLLVAGRTKAQDHPPVSPVQTSDIEAVLKVLNPMQAAMVKVQLVTAMRPGEMLQMRPADVDRSKDIWIYIPRQHKNSYRGHSRKIMLGPKAQALLLPWIIGSPDDYIFSPQKIRFCKGKRVPGERYVSTSYSRMIQRACKKAGIKSWTPHQLRHTAATNYVEKCGWAETRIILGHKSLDTTLIYAETDAIIAHPSIRRLG